MMTNLATRILLKLSHAPQKGVARNPDPHTALRNLEGAFPDIRQLIQGKRVLDFGCGTGQQVIGLALAGAASVVGLDINDRWLDMARDSAKNAGVADVASFKTALNAGERFDVVLSFNSMEHFSDPVAILNQMKSVLEPKGVILVTFAPPWLSAYGAHMHHITKVPWVHLLFSERTVMNVRNRFMTDGAMRYEDVEGGLNRMTVKRFEQLIRKLGLRPTRWQLTPMKGLPVVTQVPGVRELFTTRVSAVLQQAG